MTASVATAKPRLETVEAARGLAAVAVVAFHTNAATRHIGHATFDILRLGEFGVDFFFVLSGFIIFFVHGSEIGRPEALRDYLVKRFIRLYPLLWLVVIPTLLARTLVGSPPTLSVAATSLLLYPSMEAPYPLVVWTLRHEILFYLAFAVLVLHRRAGLALFGAWISLSLVQLALSLAGKPLEGLLSLFASTYTLDFVFGALIAAAHRRWSFGPSLVPLAIGLTAILVVMSWVQLGGVHRLGMLDYSSQSAIWGTLVIGGSFALLLHGLLCAERLFTVPKPFLLLGAASYAIYLAHTPLNSISQRLVAGWPTGLSHILIFLFGVAGGVIIHLLLERPISKALRSRLLGVRRSEGVAAAPAG